MVELLVCIGIIVAISGLVFAGYSSAVASGKKSACVSQLKQIGYVLEMYMNDNNGDLPPYEPCQNNCSPVVFPVDYRTQATLAVPTAPVAFKTALQPYAKSEGIWWCPADQFKGQHDVGLFKGDDRYSSYVRSNVFKSLLVKYHTPGHPPYSLSPKELFTSPVLLADRCFDFSDPDDINDCDTPHGRYQTQLMLDLSVRHQNTAQSH